MVQCDPLENSKYTLSICRLTLSCFLMGDISNKKKQTKKMFKSNLSVYSDHYSIYR